MKLRLLIFAAGLTVPAGLWANSLSCGSSLANLQSSACVSSGSFSFNDSMLWTSAGSAYEGPGQPNAEPPDGSALNPANSVSYSGTSTGGITITATTPSGPTTQYLGRYDEAPWVWAGPSLGWVEPGYANCTSFDYATGACLSSSNTPYLLTFQGPFDFDKSTSTIYGNGSLDANTALLGTTNGTGPIDLSFSAGVTAFGVDISGLSATSFTATLQAFDGSNSVGTYYIDAAGYGGLCASLSLKPSQGGNGCNDAPFIGIGNLGPITNVVISVTDDSTGNAAGFAIDTVLLKSANVQTPEPGAVVLIACGLGAIVVRRRVSRGSRS